MEVGEIGWRWVRVSEGVLLFFFLFYPHSFCLKKKEKPEPKDVVKSWLQDGRKWFEASERGWRWVGVSEGLLFLMFVFSFSFSFFSVNVVVCLVSLLKLTRA